MMTEPQSRQSLFRPSEWTQEFLGKIGWSPDPGGTSGKTAFVLVAFILLLGGELNATIQQYRDAQVERKERLATRKQELIAERAAFRAKAEADKLGGWPG